MEQSASIDGRTILVVEDEALLRFDMTVFFEDRGWRVLEAEDAEAAMALLDRHGDIGVVLIDVLMPGRVDGLRLAHHVRERFPPTLVIVVSGHAVPTPEQLPAQAIFLPKPFDLHRILRHIERTALSA